MAHERDTYPTGKHCKMDFPLIIIVHSHDLLSRCSSCCCCQIANQHFFHTHTYLLTVLSNRLSAHFFDLFTRYSLPFFDSISVRFFNSSLLFFRSLCYVFHYTFGFICMQAPVHTHSHEAMCASSNSIKST